MASKKKLKKIIKHQEQIIENYMASRRDLTQRVKELEEDGRLELIPRMVYRRVPRGSRVDD